jgi:DnaJ-domain-containing protein 1
MNPRLRAVIDRAEHLPDADQEALAALIEEEMEEREWEALTQRPGSRAFHDELRAELREAEERSELEEIKGDTFG